MPPHRALGFNPQVTVDDALLVSEYIYDRQLSYEDAIKALREDVASLRQELSAKGTIRFGELGTFNINITGKISFDQAPNGIDDPYNFGIEPLVINQLREIEKKEIIIKHSTLKRVAAVAAAIILTFLFVSPVGDNAYAPSMQAGFVASNTKTTVQAPAEPAMTDNSWNRCEIAPVENTVTANIITENYIPEVAQETKAETENIITEEPLSEEPTAVEEVLPTDQVTTEPVVAIEETEAEKESVAQKSFSIIVASSPNEKNAHLAIEELTAKMKAEYSIVKGNGRFRVAYGTFSSNQEAAETLSQIAGTFPDAWILIH